MSVLGAPLAGAGTKPVASRERSRQPSPVTPRYLAPPVPTAPPFATPVTRPLETEPEFSLESPPEMIDQTSRIPLAIPSTTATLEKYATRYTIHVEYTYATPLATTTTTTTTSEATTTSSSSTSVTLATTEKQIITFPTAPTFFEEFTVSETPYEEYTSALEYTPEITPELPLRSKPPKYGRPTTQPTPSVPTYTAPPPKGITPFPTFTSVHPKRITTAIPEEERERTPIQRVMVTEVSTTVAQPPETPA